MAEYSENLLQNTKYTAAIKAYGAHTVYKIEHAPSGLTGFVAIHKVRHGKVFGGIRLKKYPSEAAACDDALRLARAMTYKCVLAGIPGGGAKTVLMAPEPPADPKALFTALGRALLEINLDYGCGRDVGVTNGDMDILRAVYPRVADERPHAAGDLNYYTALGVLSGMLGCCDIHPNLRTLKHAVVAVQGAGAVAVQLMLLLQKADAKIITCDPDAAKTDFARRRFGADIVAVDEIYGVPCAIFSPCALGGVLNPETIAKLKCKAVAGCANNIFEDEARDSLLLHRRGILAPPDYLLNAGAVIQGAANIGPQRVDTTVSIEAIREKTKTLLGDARLRQIPPLRAANELVEATLAREDKASRP